ncbi:MAG TPA: signal recognition particle-docking protein FtsY [bacterium]|nr:signal recognition particle-docking protein FtsY [bacterium]
MYDPTLWPHIGPYLQAFNEVMENTGLPNATVSIPLTAVLVLLFSWILLRLVHRRRKIEATIERRKAAGEPVEEAAAEAIEEEPVEEEVEAEEIVEELEEGEEALSDEQIEAELAAEALEAEAEDVEPEPEPVVEVVPPPPPPPVEEKPKLSLFARLKQGLAKTAGGLVGRIDSVLRGRKIDQDLFDELEEVLFTADLGPTTADKLLTAVQDRVREEKIEDAMLIHDLLKEEMGKILEPIAKPLEVVDGKPYVIMVVGVNGVGKTTTIGKIASKLTHDGKSVIMGAADTFRAAADEQLTIWAERVGAEIIRQKSGADPSAVAYDAVQAAVNRAVDVVIVDTAGRLHTKHNLMEELKKIKRVMDKVHPGSPHEVLLVLDANTGQNGIAQAKSFNEALGLTGIILTKLDGTAKGGCIVGISDELQVPIRFIGIGEQIDDLRPFVAQDFVNALFDREG